MTCFLLDSKIDSLCKSHKVWVGGLRAGEMAVGVALVAHQEVDLRLSLISFGQSFHQDCILVFLIWTGAQIVKIHAISSIAVANRTG